MSSEAYIDDVLEYSDFFSGDASCFSEKDVVFKLKSTMPFNLKEDERPFATAPGITWLSEPFEILSYASDLKGFFCGKGLLEIDMGTLAKVSRVGDPPLGTP